MMKPDNYGVLQPVPPEKKRSLEGKVVAFTGRVASDLKMDAEILGASVANGTISTTELSNLWPGRAQIIVAAFGTKPRLDTATAEAVTAGTVEIWSEQDLSACIAAKRLDDKAVLAAKKKRKAASLAEIAELDRKLAKTEHVTFETAQADGYPSVPLRDGKDRDGLPKPDLPNGVSVRIISIHGKSTRVWHPAGEGVVKNRNIRPLPPPSGMPLARQKAAAEARRLGMQKDVERDWNTKARKELGLRKGTCMQLMPGPNAARVCTKCEKKGRKGWRHAWICHGCQAEQVSGECINCCDPALYGWTCLTPQCSGRGCTTCKHTSGYWRESGSRWLGDAVTSLDIVSADPIRDAVKAAAAARTANVAYIQPSVSNRPEAKDASAALQAAAAFDKSNKSQVIRDGVIAA